MWRFQNNVWRCFNSNPNEFLRRFITVDETWIHYFTPETKEYKTTRCGFHRESAPKKAKTIKSAGKVATIFWDARGIIHIDYLSSKQTINSDYYATLLDRFNNILKKKTSPFGEEESALSSRQCTGSHILDIDRQIQRIPLWIASPSRFSPLWLFPVSKSEEIVRRKEIHHQRAARWNKSLF